MTRFTDSPYERMMTQVPTERREVHGPPALPPGHPCHGCPSSPFWINCSDPFDAVYPVMKRLKPGAVIWCPFDTADSAYVKVFSRNGFQVIYGHIQTGQDFFQVDVPDCDYI